jgi:hypothetical protein
MILNLNFTDKSITKNSSNIIIFIEKDKFHYDRNDFLQMKKLI